MTTMRKCRALLPFVLALCCFVPIAAGDLTERRAEPPSEGAEDCGGDRVAGVWRARHVIDRFTYVTTLRVERVSGDRGVLRGRIDVTAFTGRGRVPPPCDPGQIAYRVTQPALGRVEGLRFDFRATSYRIEENICGYRALYNPDHVTGTIDAARPLLRAVNNDGGVAVNAPVVFRRLRCR